MKIRRRTYGKLSAIIAVLIGMTLLGLTFSTDTSAASCSGVDTAIIDCEEGGTGGIYHIVSLVLNIMTIGIGILAVLGITWVGIQYLTAGGDVTRTTKAKRRLLEIVVGLACYVVIYGLMTWLMPGGVNTGDMTGVSSMSISYSGNAYVGKTFAPTVTFNDDAVDKTYSLKSGNLSIIKASGRGAKCLEVGETTIEAVSANGMKASMAVKCQENPSEVADSSSNSSSTDGENTTGSMANTKLNGDPNFRKQTRNIINDHRLDFDHNTYTRVIRSKKYGSYKKYVKSLGGVFTEHYNTGKFKIKTAADFQEMGEYVMGLLTIWGVDYNNSTPSTQRYFRPWRWGNTWDNSGKSDRFYVGLGEPCYYRGHIGVDEKLKSGCNVVNCNDFVDTLIHTTKLKHIAAASSGQSTSALSKYPVIRNISKLKVGDVMHFYNSSSGPYNGSGWAHVAVVGEVYKDYIVMYDGGRVSIGNGKFKRAIKRYNGNKLQGEGYSGYGTRWVAIRPWNIDQSVTLKGIN